MVSHGRVRLESASMPVPTVLSLFDLNPRKFGSLEEYTVALSRALQTRGWRCVLVFSHPVTPAIARYFEGTGAVFEVLENRGKLRLYLDLVRLLRKYRPGVIHFHFIEQFSFVPILASLVRPRLLVFTDHFRQPQPIGVVTRTACILWDRIIFRLLDVKIVAVSEHIKRTLVECYLMTPQRIEVVYNGVNPRRFAPLDSRQVIQFQDQWGIPPGSPVIFCAAALIPEKGVSDLLAAAQQVLPRRPDTILMIAGDGPLLAALQRETERLGIHEKVRFIGLRSDLECFMARAQVVVVPSVWQEPAGLVVVEGMATGRPIVATRVGGIPEYLVDGVTGILVDPHAPEQIAAALLRLLDSPSEAAAMGRAGRVRVENCFSMDRWVQETVQMYERALAANPKK